MRKGSKKFKSDSRGAVTVFVTLLLIPAILVTGTGVDAARVYSARSTLQNANQLAANSTLASYDALLKDLYGLFAIMEDDEDFAQLVDRYVRTAVFGEEQITRIDGLKLLDGSGLEVSGPVAQAGQNLKNTEVLRRQIEEYSKFRAPVIVVQDILSIFDSFEKADKDSEIIEEKTQIDEGLEDITEQYRKIYECINEVNKSGDIEKGYVGEVNKYFDKIEAAIGELVAIRTEYTMAVENNDLDKAADAQEHYEGQLSNIRALINGGYIKEGWIPGGYDENGEFRPGYWMSTSRREDGMDKAIERASDGLEHLIDNSANPPDSLGELKELCRKAQAKKSELQQKVRDLKDKLTRNSSDYSKELVNGMTEPAEGETKSLLEKYEDLLEYDLPSMAEAMAEIDEPQIRSVIDSLENAVYGDGRIENSYSRDRIGKWSSTDFPIDFDVIQRMRDPSVREDDPLMNAYSVIPRDITIDTVFLLFQDQHFSETKNPDFYDQLKKLFASDEKHDKQKKNLEKGMKNVMGQIQDAMKGLSFDPLGAYSISNSGFMQTTPADDIEDITGGNWSDGSSAVMDQMSGGIDLFKNMLVDAADKILLMTYDTCMFSNYTSPDGTTASPEKTMTDIPMGIGVNYFFQSELEYLYAGTKDARANLAAVAGMIFLVRFVMNYIASFTNPAVVNMVNAVEGALAWAGPFAIVAGELVRFIMVLGESTMDVARLRSGSRVKVMKLKATDWKFSIEGLLDMATGEVGDLAVEALTGASGDDSDDDGLALTYKNYLTLFLLMRDGDVLAARTADLILLNLTYYKNSMGSLPSREARESAMSGAKLVDLSKAITGFSLTTSVDLRMLFLSMPVARKGINGTVPPGQLHLTVTDYRGY